MGTYNTPSQGQSGQNLAARLATINRYDLNDKVLRRLFADIDFNNLTDTDAVLLDDILGFETQRITYDDINKEVRMILLGQTGNG